MKYFVYSLSIFYILVCVIFFYAVGANKFPDYENYLIIAKLGGITGEKDYWFEWISRFLLSSNYLDEISRIYITTAVNQVICICIFFLLVYRRDRHAIGICLVVFMFYFLFLTTTIRASVAYLCVALFFIKEKWLDIRSFFLLLFAIAWHDSAAIFMLMFFAFKFFPLIKRIIPVGVYEKIPFFILMISVFSFLASNYIFVIFSDFFDLGSRAEYLNNGDGVSLFKELYFYALLLFVAYFLKISGVSTEKKYFISVVTLVLMVIGSFNQVAGIRFSFYLLIIILLENGGVFKNKNINYIIFAFAPLFIFYNINSVLKI